MVHEVCIFGEPCPGMVNTRKSCGNCGIFAGIRPSSKPWDCSLSSCWTEQVVVWYPWWWRITRVLNIGLTQLLHKEGMHGVSKGSDVNAAGTADFWKIKKVNPKNHECLGWIEHLQRQSKMCWGYILSPKSLRGVSKYDWWWWKESLRRGFDLIFGSTKHVAALLYPVCALRRQHQMLVLNLAADHLNSFSNNQPKGNTLGATRKDRLNSADIEMRWVIFQTGVWVLKCQW